MTYPHPDPDHYHEAAGENPCGTWHNVHNVTYHIHNKMGKDSQGNEVVLSRTMKVIYHSNKDIFEWVCLEHPEGSFIRKKSDKWWIERAGEPLPPTLELAVDWAEKSLKRPSRIKTEPDGKFTRIVDYDWSEPFDEMPEFDPNDIPF